MIFIEMVVLKELKKIITAVLEEKGITVKKVILFGSRAREEEKPESDWDILVLVKEKIPMHEKISIWYAVSHAIHERYPISLDLIIKSIDDFEKEKEVVNTISSEAALEGREI